MSASKKLVKALRAVVKLIEEEAQQNPRFAERLELILTDLDKGSTARAQSRGQGLSEKSSDKDLPDVFEEYEKVGSEEFRFWLRTLDLGTLKSIVSANGFDPEKRASRWTEPDKVIDLIFSQTEARLKRGSSFLE